MGRSARQIERSVQLPPLVVAGWHSGTTFGRRPIDPGGGGFGEGTGNLVNEPRGVLCKRAIMRNDTALDAST